MEYYNSRGNFSIRHFSMYVFLFSDLTLVRVFFFTPTGKIIRKNDISVKEGGMYEK